MMGSMVLVLWVLFVCGGVFLLLFLFGFGGFFGGKCIVLLCFVVVLFCFNGRPYF